MRPDRLSGTRCVENLGDFSSLEERPGAPPVRAHLRVAFREPDEHGREVGRLTHEGPSSMDLIERLAPRHDGSDTQLVVRFFVAFSSALALSRCFCTTGYVSATH